MILRGLKFLRAPVMHARFDQRNHAVGDQLAVHAQVLTVHQEGQHRIGNSADARLQHRTIFDQAGDVARDGDLHLGDFGLLQRTERAGRLPRWHRSC